MVRKEIQKTLEGLDFSPYDGAVYIALFQHGPCNAGPIIRETSLHRNIVYTSLDHLISRKLVTEKISRGRKIFSAISPDNLRQEYGKKAELATTVAKELEKIHQQDIQEISVHQGNEEYLDLLTSIIRQMPAGSTKYVLGTGGKAFMDITMTPISHKYHKVALAQKIKIKMLSYEHQKKALDQLVREIPIYQIRYLPSNIENPSGVHIYPEVKTVLNVIYSNEDTPVTAIKIKNPALVQGYLNLFNNLWK
ncbi:MAG: helix-turn-helix domain-containing protein, partial [Patescibacteria group bacterium]